MKILTHNAYWFQGYPSRWGAEQVAEVPDVLRALEQLYASAGVDVLCLQEVHRRDLAENLARALGMKAWLHAPGGLRPDYGGAVMASREARLRDCTHAEGHSPHERIHMRASLELDGSPFEIAVVHLPSNRFAGPAPGAGTAARIAELARVLAEPARPHLVLGDMNFKPDSPPYDFMRDAGYVDAAAVAEGDAASKSRFTGGDGPAAKHRVDYMWLDARYADRLASFAVLDTGAFCRTTPEGVLWRLSDHPPLLMELR